MADDRNLMGTFGREKLAQPCGERRVTHGTVGRGLWQVVSKIRDTVRSHTSSSKETAAAERRMAEGAKSEATDAEGTHASSEGLSASIDHVAETPRARSAAIEGARQTTARCANRSSRQRGAWRTPALWSIRPWATPWRGRFGGADGG
jgi:hypothetical protein